MGALEWYQSGWLYRSDVDADVSHPHSGQASQSGAVLDLGSVNQEDETWINGTYLGASSFASRTQYPIPPGVLKPGVNIVTTNIYCG